MKIHAQTKRKIYPSFPICEHFFRLKSVRDNISDELQGKIGDAVERLHNLESEGHKIRGQQGWERDANLAEGYSTCRRKAALDDYSAAMKEAMLSDEQKANVYPDFDFQRVREDRVDPLIKKKKILQYGGKRELRKKGFLTDDGQLNIPGKWFNNLKPPNGSRSRHKAEKITHWAHVGAWPT